MMPLYICDWFSEPKMPQCGSFHRTNDVTVSNRFDRSSETEQMMQQCNNFTETMMPLCDRFHKNNDATV